MLTVTPTAAAAASHARPFDIRRIFGGGARARERYAHRRRRQAMEQTLRKFLRAEDGHSSLHIFGIGITHAIREAAKKCGDVSVAQVDVASFGSGGARACLQKVRQFIRARHVVQHGQSCRSVLLLDHLEASARDLQWPAAFHLAIRKLVRNPSIRCIVVTRFRQEGYRWCGGESILTMCVSPRSPQNLAIMLHMVTWMRLWNDCIDNIHQGLLQTWQGPGGGMALECIESKTDTLAHRPRECLRLCVQLLTILAEAREAEDMADDLRSVMFNGRDIHQLNRQMIGPRSGLEAALPGVWKHRLDRLVQWSKVRESGLGRECVKMVTDRMRTVHEGTMTHYELDLVRTALEISLTLTVRTPTTTSPPQELDQGGGEERFHPDCTFVSVRRAMQTTRPPDALPRRIEDVTMLNLVNFCRPMDGTAGTVDHLERLAAVTEDISLTDDRDEAPRALCPERNAMLAWIRARLPSVHGIRDQRGRGVMLETRTEREGGRGHFVGCSKWW